MAPTVRPTPRTRTAEVARPTAQRKRPSFAPGVLPLVIICSILLSAGMAFGNPLIWRTFDEQAADAPAVDQPGAEDSGDTPAMGDPNNPNDVLRGSYTAVSKSEDEARCENIRLGAEAINGKVIQPGEEFSFNDAVGNLSAESGYQDVSGANGGEGSQDDGGISQVATALYIAAVRSDLEVTERHAHSAPSDYAPIGLEATIVHGTFDLRIKNNTDYPATIHAKAQGQSVEVSITGEALPEGLTVDATSQVVQQYQRDNVSGQEQQYYVTESFKVYYQDGERSTRDLLASDIYLVEDKDSVVLADGSAKPTE